MWQLVIAHCIIFVWKFAYWNWIRLKNIIIFHSIDIFFFKFWINPKIAVKWSWIESVPPISSAVSRYTRDAFYIVIYYYYYYEAQFWCNSNLLPLQSAFDNNNRINIYCPQFPLIAWHILTYSRDCTQMYGVDRIVKKLL